MKKKKIFATIESSTNIRVFLLYIIFLNCKIPISYFVLKKMALIYNLWDRLRGSQAYTSFITSGVISTTMLQFGFSFLGCAAVNSTAKMNSSFSGKLYAGGIIAAACYRFYQSVLYGDYKKLKQNLVKTVATAGVITLSSTLLESPVILYPLRLAMGWLMGESVVSSLALVSSTCKQGNVVATMFLPALAARLSLTPSVTFGYFEQAWGLRWYGIAVLFLTSLLTMGVKVEGTVEKQMIDDNDNGEWLSKPLISDLLWFTATTWSAVYNARLCLPDHELNDKSVQSASTTIDQVKNGKIQQISDSITDPDMDEEVLNPPLGSIIVNAIYFFQDCIGSSWASAITPGLGWTVFIGIVPVVNYFTFDTIFTKIASLFVTIGIYQSSIVPLSNIMNKIKDKSLSVQNKCCAIMIGSIGAAMVCQYDVVYSDNEYNLWLCVFSLIRLLYVF